MHGTLWHAITIVGTAVASLNEHPTTLNLSLDIATSSTIIMLLLLEVASYPHDPASLSHNLNASCPKPRASPPLLRFLRLKATIASSRSLRFPANLSP
jgi:hypothetical protein